jgi:thiamine-phosphate diphosphorylase
MLKLPALYPLTDATRPEPLADQVRRLGEAGFPLVQFRGKPLPVAEQYNQLKRALEDSAANGGWPRIALNDRPDLALVLASEGLAPWGLHLGQDDLPHALAAQLPGLAGLHFGASTHGPAQWRSLAAPVDHAGVGPFRATGTKANHDAPIGVEGLRQGCAALREQGIAPIAIGGLRLEDAEACFDAGAESLAMVGAVHAAADPADLGWAVQAARWKVRPPVAKGQGLVLVGASGAGKSTLGRALAPKLGLPFHDLDEVIVARMQRSIADLFATEGEAAFRTLERELLPELLQSPAVLALGGGAWEQAAVRAAAEGAGFKTLWLAESPGKAWARVAQDPSRPLARDRASYMALCRTRLRGWVGCEAVVPFGRSVDELLEAMNLG